MKNLKILVALFLLSLALNHVTVAETTKYAHYYYGTVKVPKGYHDSDDKSDFWIPNNVNPLMMQNLELEKYRIIKDTSKFKDPFSKHYLEKAQKENRPLIKNDITNINHDYNLLYGINGLDYNLTDRNGRLGCLSREEEVILKKLQEEYGEDSEIFGEEFKRHLNLYRQRQQHMKQNTGGLVKQLYNILK